MKQPIPSTPDFQGRSGKRPGTFIIFAPAKINLFLAVTGRRADGFHELVSVVAQVNFGDTLHMEERAESSESRVESPEPRGGEGRSRFTLECDDSAGPVDGTNLVLRAAEAFATVTGWKGEAHFRLEKRIPMGAGLGGGSSNAVAALRALNQLAGEPLPEGDVVEFALLVEPGLRVRLRHEGRRGREGPLINGASP